MLSSARDHGRGSVAMCRQRRRADQAGTPTSTPANSPTSSNVLTRAMPPRTGNSFSSSPAGRWRRRQATPANPRCPCPDRHSKAGRRAERRGDSKPLIEMWVDDAPPMPGPFPPGTAPRTPAAPYGEDLMAVVKRPARRRTRCSCDALDPVPVSGRWLVSAKPHVASLDDDTPGRGGQDRSPGDLHDVRRSVAAAAVNVLRDRATQPRATRARMPWRYSWQ